MVKYTQIRTHSRPHVIHYSGFQLNAEKRKTKNLARRPPGGTPDAPVVKYCIISIDSTVTCHRSRCQIYPVIQLSREYIYEVVEVVW
jgi:hypothetical protein